VTARQYPAATSLRPDAGRLLLVSAPCHLPSSRLDGSGAQRGASRLADRILLADPQDLSGWDMGLGGPHSRPLIQGKDEEPAAIRAHPRASTEQWKAKILLLPSVPTHAGRRCRNARTPQKIVHRQPPLALTPGTRRLRALCIRAG